ncbi:MAG: radical SAM protein [Clostridia bacterium]|nr:radical SAM protein [Clostridia bacterium]
MIVYGPVPSRRLGRSIGINNIPPKVCSYSCPYCQLGRTNTMQIKRVAFHNPEDILKEAEAKLEQLAAENIVADYFSFVPDGEPTLDINLGTEIRMLKPMGVKIAVISNASLLWMEDVMEDLMQADWVSVSIDAADEKTWKRINRPHGLLKHREVLDGIARFAKDYKGVLVSETMLVDGINDNIGTIGGIAEILGEIKPAKAYLLVPARPPAENWVKRASRESLSMAVGIIRGKSGISVECITGDEEEEGFFFSEDIANDLMGITSVHPVRESVMNRLIEKRNIDGSIITELVNQGKISELYYEGRKYYRKNTNAGQGK